ncbi:cytidine deaminase [Acetobacter aceti NRIC 0242]|uniref:Cytidine deaminase n=1 Tax=Acetobacter aceti NBRC 14818 TaxID=887700 RepID=A0AB33I8Z3_ACEAC|nr:cytidine deaminase [Acetobacter aceti]TCS32805.1 cytidine deaminase [Acetobacter aceti NBRC 14818]BCK74782.1 cytidine deaminase [Acetobacter aceti NBRC 14818]GAN58077.1 cytidine deaminase [Acetobacter aceti NBRC 14818]GBO81025.1 cytidine deaminase [Acetobacter aceti NRIC 0242]
MTSASQQTDVKLIEAASAVRERAYAPYSGFKVGAALRCDDGQVHVGCNVENAAYPEGICAEGGAIAAMVAAGGRKIVEIVVCGGGSGPCTPCGGCRQKLREFGAPGMRVYMTDPAGQVLLVKTLSELLPDSFGPESLD